jgi:surface antigen
MNTKITKFMIPLVAASALALAGCAGQGQKQTGGTLAGAWIGNKVGTSLDNADKAAMRQSSQYALEATKTGHTSNWTNPDSGNSGTVTPTKTYQTAEGEYCREYQQTVTVAGKTQEAYGKACRQPDGSWKVRN